VPETLQITNSKLTKLGIFPDTNVWKSYNLFYRRICTSPKTICMNNTATTQNKHRHSRCAPADLQTHKANGL